MIAPVVGSVPNSSLVSARITPRSRAIASARPYTASVSSRSDAAVSAPTVSTTVSNGTFSSCSPSSALVAGVKIGSGSREPSTSPAGSAMPVTEPDTRYSASPDPVR